MRRPPITTTTIAIPPPMKARKKLWLATRQGRRNGKAVPRLLSGTHAAAVCRGSDCSDRIVPAGGAMALWRRFIPGAELWKRFDENCLRHWAGFAVVLLRRPVLAADLHFQGRNLFPPAQR